MLADVKWGMPGPAFLGNSLDSAWILEAAAVPKSFDSAWKIDEEADNSFDSDLILDDDAEAELVDSGAVERIDSDFIVTSWWAVDVDGRSADKRIFFSGFSSDDM